MYQESPLQGMIDAMGEASSRERAKYHLTLGELIDALEDADGDTPVVFENGESPGRFTSYRGYYHDLALTPNDDEITAAALLDKAREALDSDFTGYKGGEFHMDENTPLWKSPWGGSSDDRSVMGIEKTGDEMVLRLGDSGF